MSGSENTVEHSDLSPFFSGGLIKPTLVAASGLSWTSWMDFLAMLGVIWPPIAAVLAAIILIVTAVDKVRQARGWVRQWRAGRRN